MVYLRIDKTLTKPMYQQIFDQIMDMIKNKQLNHLDLLPSESQFKYIYDVSNFVVKRAYKMLENEDLIVRVKGRGTFVNLRKTFYMDAFKLDTVYIPKGIDFKYKLLSKNLIEGDYKVRKALNAIDNTQICSYKVVTLRDNLPVSYSELNFISCNTLIENEARSGDKTLKQVLSEKYQGKIEVVTIFNAASSTKIISEILNVPTNSPLIVTDTTFFHKDNPVAQVMTLYPGQYTVIEAMAL